MMKKFITIFAALFVTAAVQASETTQPEVDNQRRPSISVVGPVSQASRTQKYGSMSVLDSTPETLMDGLKNIKDELTNKSITQQEAISDCDNMLKLAKQAQENQVDQQQRKSYEPVITQIEAVKNRLVGRAEALDTSFLDEKKEESKAGSVQEQIPTQPASPTNSENSSSSPAPTPAQQTKDPFEELRSEQEALLKNPNATLNKLEALKTKMSLVLGQNDLPSIDRERYQQLQKPLADRITELSLSPGALEQINIAQEARRVNQTLQKQKAKYLKFYKEQVLNNQQTSISTLISELGSLREQAETIWANLHKTMNNDKYTIHKNKKIRAATNDTHQKNLDAVANKCLESYKRLFTLYGKLNSNLKCYERFVVDADKFIEKLQLQALEERVKVTIQNKEAEKYEALIKEINDIYQAEATSKTPNMFLAMQYNSLLKKLREAQPKTPADSPQGGPQVPLNSKVSTPAPAEAHASTPAPIPFATLEQPGTNNTVTADNKKPDQPKVEDASQQKLQQDPLKEPSFFARGTSTVTRFVKNHKLLLGFVGFTAATVVGYRYGNSITKYFKKLALVRAGR